MAMYLGENQINWLNNSSGWILQIPPTSTTLNANVSQLKSTPTNIDKNKDSLKATNE